MMNYKKKTTLAVLGLAAALLSTAAQAITLVGTQVSYSFDSADLGLFGTASLSGDNLVFTPTIFEASTNGSHGSGPIAYQTMHITVSANTGYQLSSLSLTESGSYSLTGSASAFVTGNITALDIEGTTDLEEIGTITPNAPFDVIGTPTGWTANAGVILPATGWGGTDGVVNSIGLKITNQLYAASASGGTADIWKNVVGLSVVTSPIPEADTYAMMLVGLGLVGFMARRSRASV